MKILSMKCQSCGAALEIPPETERFFCTYCGTAQIVQRLGETASQFNEPKYEICEIETEERLKKRSFLRHFVPDTIEAVAEAIGVLDDTLFDRKYVAKAVGPNGVYIAAETDYGDRLSAEDLVARLVKEKWEPTGKNKEGHYKFKRRVG